MKVKLTLVCRCGCEASESSTFDWSEDLPLDEIVAAYSMYRPHSILELRPAGVVDGVSRILREKTVDAILEDESREALR